MNALMQRQRLVTLVVLVLMTLLLSGASCGVQQLERPPETIQEGLYIANVYGKGLTHSINDAYVTRVIEKEDQLEALDVLQQAKDATATGLAAYQVGNFTQAGTSLDVAEGVLKTVALIVAKFGDSP